MSIQNYLKENKSFSHFNNLYPTPYNILTFHFPITNLFSNLNYFTFLSIINLSTFYPLTFVLPF